MLLDKPYFLTNEEWYIEITNKPSFLLKGDKRRYKLTDKAPKEAVDSYNKYYEKLNINEDAK